MDYMARTFMAAGIFLSVSSPPLMSAEFHPIDSISSNTGASDFFAVGNLVNGPGIDFEASPPHSATPQRPATASLWVTDACGSRCDYYLTLPTPILTIDLGADRPLNEISIWGYSSTNTNGASKASLRFATEAEGISGFGTSVTFSPALNLLIDPTIRQSFSFGRTFSARYVEITLPDNFFLAPGDGSNNNGIAGGDRVGLGEIAFAVPELDQEELFVSAPNSFELSQGFLGDTSLSQLISDLNFWSVVPSSSTGLLYLSIPTSGLIVQVDPESGILTTLVNSPGAVFHGLAINEELGILYAANSGTDLIESYNLTTGATAGSFGMNLVRPNEILFNSESQQIIVSDSGIDAIQIYDLSGTLLSTRADATTNGVWGLALDPTNGDLLYSSHDLGTIFRTDLGGSVSAAEHENLQGPRGLGYDRQGRLYCVESGLSQIRTFGPAPTPIYSSAAGGRDISLRAECDLDGDLLPDDWESSFGGLNFTFLGDSDEDGLFDGLEAALGSNPNLSEGSNLRPLTIDDDGKITLSHQTLKKSKLTYNLSLSTDLVNWLPATTLPNQDEGAGLYNISTYSFTLEDEGYTPETPELFSRISVAPSF